VFDKITPELFWSYFVVQNLLLLAYDARFSGKSHTTLGTKTDLGILPRCLELIIKTIGSQIYTGPLKSFGGSETTWTTYNTGAKEGSRI